VNLLTISVTETVGGVVETLPTTTLDRPCYIADLRGATVPAGQSGALAFNLGTVSVTWNGVGQSMTHQNVEDVGGTSAWPPLTSFTTGSVYEIEATGVNAHPMHIHVNPYQIQDMGGSDSLDDGYFQAGDWHDTLYINSLGGGNTVTVRMNTDRFTGDMVIHCHILSHEDRGMMGYISLTGTEGDVFAGAKVLDPSCYDTAFVGAPVPAPTPAPPPAPTDATPEPSPTFAPPPTLAPCADDDARIITLASGAGLTISGCADVESYCEDAAYGSTVQAICPATCGLCTAPCADDDAQAIALASGAGFTISACDDVQPYCEHSAYGSTLQTICPATCGLCTRRVRRLADGKGPYADELDWIDELTVVAPPTPVPAAEVGKDTEEFSKSEANLIFA